MLPQSLDSGGLNFVVRRFVGTDQVRSGLQRELRGHTDVRDSILPRSCFQQRGRHRYGLERRLFANLVRSQTLAIFHSAIVSGPVNRKSGLVGLNGLTPEFKTRLICSRSSLDNASHQLGAIARFSKLLKAIRNKAASALLPHGHK
jgi:hypothetical protein